MTAMPLMVPRGMLLRGSRNSPLMLMPTMMPVTAGKKTAKTVQKPPSAKSPHKVGVRCMPGWSPMARPPIKMEINDRTTTARISNCTREANWALM